MPSPTGRGARVETRVAVVQGVGVLLGRVRDRAHVQDAVNGVPSSPCEPISELFRRDDVQEAPPAQVLPLALPLPRSSTIRMSSRPRVVQRPHQRAADKSRAACHHQHKQTLRRYYSTRTAEAKVTPGGPAWAGAGPTDLTDAQWQAVQECLPKARGGRTGRKRKYRLREIVNSLFHLLRTGCPWRRPAPRPAALGRRL